MDILLYDGGYNCLSGNTFTNNALYSDHTNITSCFRKGLIDCIDKNTIDCQNGIYGEIDPLLYHHVTNIFVSNVSVHYKILHAEECNIALDNVNIIIILDTTTIVLSCFYGNIMLIDSYITDGYDISYDNENCNLLKNNKLLNNKQYIPSLLLYCEHMKDLDDRTERMVSSDPSYTYYVDDFIESWDSNSSAVSYINHLSPIQLNLSVNSSYYYPGESLIFYYNILDKIGNKISINYISMFLMINIKTNLFSTTLQIEQDGSCQLCDDGLSINTISIEQDLGKELKIYYTIDNNMLFPADSYLSLYVVGCPIMYNPTDNNYTCIPCNTDYYNLYPNNIEYCKSCVQIKIHLLNVKMKPLLFNKIIGWE